MRALWLLVLLPFICEAQLATTPGGGTMWYKPAASGGTVVTNQADLIVNDLGSSSSTANTTSYTCTLNQPATNSLILAFVEHTQTSPVAVPTSLSGNNVTWVMCGVTNNAGASTTNMLTVWRAQGANPTAGTLTVNVASSTGCEIHVLEVQGADSSAANGANAIVQVQQTNGVSANPLISIAQSSGLATNAFILCVADGVNATTGRAANTNWVLLSSQGHNTPPAGFGLQFQTTATTNITITETATSRTWLSILVEVKPGLEADPTTRPSLVQYLQTRWLQLSTTPYITNLSMSLNNPALPGNLLELYCLHNYGSSMSIKDDKGNNWTLATNYLDSGDGLTLDCYYATNVVGGTLLITNTFNTNTVFFSAYIAEYAHVKKYQPIDSMSSQLIGTAVPSAGLMTNSTDGDLVSMYAVNGPGQFTTTLVKGFRSYGQHNVVTDNDPDAYAGWVVQAKAGPINPTVDLSQSATFAWDTIAVAYKRSADGTLPDTNNIRIVGSVQCGLDGSSNPSLIYTPAVDGNLLVMTFEGYYTQAGVTNVADTSGNTTWLLKTPQLNDGPQNWSASNYVGRANPPNIISVKHNGTYGESCTVYSIANASAYPMDAYGETNGYQTTLNGPAYGATVTPSQTGGLFIEIMATGQGPANAVFGIGGTAPIDIVPYYWYMDDFNTLGLGCAWAHCYESNTSPVQIGYYMTNNLNNSTYTSIGVNYKHK